MSPAAAAQVAALEDEAPEGLIRVPDEAHNPAEGSCVVVFQLGGAVLAAGCEWDRIERRVRDQLYRYGEMSLARKLPFADRPLDLRNVKIRVWGEDGTEAGAIYRAWCSEALVEKIVLGAKLDVPWDLVPGEPVELAMKPARPRLTLTGPVEEVPPAEDRHRPRHLQPRPFTARDILELREFTRDADIPPEAAPRAAGIATSRFLSVLARAELADRMKLEPLWLAKAARAIRQASEALELALNFGKAEARAEAQS